MARKKKKKTAPQSTQSFINDISTFQVQAQEIKKSLKSYQEKSCINNIYVGVGYGDTIIIIDGEDIPLKIKNEIEKLSPAKAKIIFD